MTDWKAEAEYWRERHLGILRAIDDIAWGRNDHPDGTHGALMALHYGETGGRGPSPAERVELRRLLEKRRDNG